MELKEVKSIYVLSKEFGNDLYGNYWIAQHIVVNHDLVLYTPITSRCMNEEQLALETLRKTIAIPASITNMYELSKLGIFINTHEFKHCLKREVKAWGIE